MFSCVLVDISITENPQPRTCFTKIALLSYNVITYINYIIIMKQLSTSLSINHLVTSLCQLNRAILKGEPIYYLHIFYLHFAFRYLFVHYGRDE